MIDDWWFVSGTPGVEDVLLRLVAACLFGGCVGWDREAEQKEAGLRTHMLVALGAATFGVLAVLITDGEADPMQVVQGVAAGIGFLGAGQILQMRGAAVGLTTAAGIWVVGGVGLACGMGATGLAALVTVLALAILRGLQRVSAWLNPATKSPAQRPPPRA